jgi:hypothetical protein
LTHAGRLAEGTAGGAFAVSVGGGLVALWRTPAPSCLSLVLGVTSGVLFATITLEIIPQAVVLGLVAVVGAGFLVMPVLAALV